MDKLDKIIKNSLNNEKTSDKYNQMINNTMKMIANNEIKKENNANATYKKKHTLLKFFQPIAAVFVLGILSVTTYATVSRTFKYW